MAKHKQKRPKSKPPKPAAASRTFAGFRPRERLIYQYHDGTKDRRGDPLALIRQLMTFDGLALDVDVKLAVGQSPEAMTALGRVVAATRSIFGLSDFDAETLALLLHFLTFIAAVQRDAGPLPTLPDVTASPAGNGSVTANGAACGSAAAAH